MGEMKEGKCFSAYDAYIYLLQVWKEFNLYRYVSQYKMIGKISKEGGKTIYFLDIIYSQESIETCAEEHKCRDIEVLEMRKTRGRLIRTELERLNEEAEDEGKNLYLDASTLFFV